MAEKGQVTLDVHEGLEGPEGLERLLQAGFELEAAGRKGERGSAVLQRPDASAFYGPRRGGRPGRGCCACASSGWAVNPSPSCWASSPEGS